MPPSLFIAWLSSISLGGFVAGTVSGQTFPAKPLRIVTSGAGGGADFVARLIAQGISAGLGQQVIVDNRASGVVPGEIVARSPPDGYTLLVSGGTLWIGRLLQTVPYDPLADFVPISLVTRASNVLVVHPSLPVRSVPELIALAKARPGQLNYSSSGAAGGSSHLAGELFKSMARIDIVRIPYKTSAAEMGELMGGHVQLTFATAGSVAQIVKFGKLRALAVTSRQPSAFFPGLPPVAAFLPGFEAEQILGVFAPAQTTTAVVLRLNQEIVRFLGTAEATTRLLNSGVESVGSSPEALAAAMKSEMARYGKVIKDAGIRAD